MRDQLFSGGSASMMTSGMLWAVVICLSVGALADAVVFSRWCPSLPVGAILGILVGLVIGWRSEA